MLANLIQTRLTGLFYSLLTICFVASATLSASQAFAAEELLQGTVTKIVDGDTVHFHDVRAPQDVKDLKTRLVGIDAPESHFVLPDGSTVGQIHGANSPEILNRLTPGWHFNHFANFSLRQYHRVLGRLFFVDVTST